MIGMLGETFKLWTQEDLANTQLEALIDASLFVMFADRTIKAAEEEQLNGILRDIPWRGGISPDAYVSRAIARVRKAHESDDEADRFLSEVALKVETREFAERLIEACLEMAGADREIKIDEKLALERLKARLLSAP